jgi:membrane protease YdiL (CAAX protease family)
MAAGMRASLLGAYLVGAFAIAWFFFGLGIAIGRGLLPLPVPPTAFVVLGTLGPAAAGLLATRFVAGPMALRDLLGRSARWRVPAVWYAIALLGPAVWILLSAVVHTVFGGDQWPSPVPGAQWLTLPLLIVAFFVPGLLEEVGWRGVALPQLRPRFGLLVASLLVGLIHAVWHAPLWFLPGFGFDALPFPLYAVQVMALGVLFAWIYAGARESVLLAGIAHGAVNACANAWGMALIARPQGVEGLEVAWSTTAGLVILAALVAVFGLSGRRAPSDYDRQHGHSLAA